MKYYIYWGCCCSTVSLCRLLFLFFVFFLFDHWMVYPSSLLSVWPLNGLSFFSSFCLTIEWSILLLFFLFDHWMVYPSSIYGFLLKHFFFFPTLERPGYSRNASCTPNLISTFLLQSLGRLHCLWTIIPRGYHLSSIQCFSTDMVY